MPPIPVLETERLRLVPLNLADAPAVQRRFPRWDVVRYLGAQVPWPYPEDGAAQFLAGAAARNATGEKNAWSIRVKSGPDEAVGIIELWPPDEDRDSRGFWLDPKYQGRGLMTEAADRITDYAFRDLGWPSLWFGNAKANAPSARLVDETPFRFVCGEDLRQTWRLDAADWLARRVPGGTSRA